MDLNNSSFPTVPVEHVCVTSHDLGELDDSDPDGLLDVWYSISFADGSDLWLGLLVLEHAHVWEHVMLDLIVQPSVEVINHVGREGSWCSKI